MRIVPVNFFIINLLVFIVSTGTAFAGSGEGGGSDILVLLGLFVFATLMALAEICLIPGFGIAGIAAVCTLAFCGYQSYVFYGASNGMIISVVLFALAGVIVYFAMKMMARTAVGRDFILEKSIDGSSGLTKRKDIDPDLWIGRKMKAVSDLRPAGKATFDNQTLEVFSENEFLRRGSVIEVVKVVDGKIFVRKTAGEEEK